MYKSGAERVSSSESSLRQRLRGKFLKFGISFLDAATRGISPNDLILLGAPTGIGKTELCVQIALANIEDGKRVHFIALEADQDEIERRLLYALIVRQFFDDPNRPKLDGRINMADWMKGTFDLDLAGYEKIAVEYLSKTLKDLFTFYKTDTFDTNDLIREVMSAAVDDTDLIIIDHVHFFDWEQDNDNRAIKEIAKTARKVSQISGKPILLVAHLRKRDRHNKELVPGVDEFHGSSDLTKIATKVITLAKGPKDSAGKDVTYFRICKNRIDGSITRYVGRLLFNFKTRQYDEKIKLSEVGDEFKELLEYPWWAREIRDNAGSGLGGPVLRVPAAKPFGIND